MRIFGPTYYRFNNLSEEYYTNPRGYHDVIRTEGKHTVYGLEYHENEHRYRISINDNYSSVESPQKNVLGLGDSFLYGRGVRYEDICLTRLEEMLNQGPNRIAIKNCGVVGGGIEDVVDIYARESASLPPGSLVIYGLVLNDFGLDFSPSIKGLNFIDLNNGGYTFNPLRKHSALVNFIFHSIETRHLHTATVNAYVESFEGKSAKLGFQRLEELNRRISDDGGSFIVVVFPLLYDFEDYRFRSIHQKIEEFCERERILFLDLLPAFSRHRAEDLWANPTDHHPNEKAHRVAAEEIATFLEDELPGFSQRSVATVSE